MDAYLVYRKGSNAANQSMTIEWVPIAIVRAASQDEAEATTWGGERPSIHSCPRIAAEVLASCGNLDVWPNQHIKAVLDVEADDEDWNSVLEADAMRQTT